MEREFIRRFFETRMAARAHAVQRALRRVPLDTAIAAGVTLALPAAALGAAALVYQRHAFGLDGARLWAAVAAGVAIAIAAATYGARRLVPAALTARRRAVRRFHDEVARPAVAWLRPGWSYDATSTLTPDELFASRLFQRIPLTRFATRGRVRGEAYGLPFEMHDVAAAGDTVGGAPRIVLRGFLAHVRLPEPLPGHARLCRRLGETIWRRPPMDGYRPLAAAAAALGDAYHVDATPDGLDPHGLPGLMPLMADLAGRGGQVHVAYGGLSAWVAIERSRPWFEPRPQPPYAADDLVELDEAFAIVEHLTQHLAALRAAGVPAS